MGDQTSAKGLQGTIAFRRCPDACCPMLPSPAQGFLACSGHCASHGMQLLLRPCNRLAIGCRRHGRSGVLQLEQACQSPS